MIHKSKAILGLFICILLLIFPSSNVNLEMNDDTVGNDGLLEKKMMRLSLPIKSGVSDREDKEHYKKLAFQK